MANPVLSAKGVFAPAPQQYVAPQQGLNGYVPQAYNPYAAQAYAAPQPGWQAAPVTERMTFEDVINKTAISLTFLVLVAAAAYVMLPDSLLYPVGLVGGLAAFIAPLVVARSRSASPAGNIVYAIAEGLMLAAFSKIFEMYYPGIIVQGVVGTLMAAGVTLVAYRFGGFRLTSKMQKMVRIGLFAFVGVALLNLVLFFFGVDTGMFPGPTGPVSMLAWIVALVGVGLAVFSLVGDFQYIEAGVAAGAPRSQGWVAAFGLSVTMIWLYVNIIRILSYIRR